MRSLFVGTSGYSYKHWKGVFYPETLAQKRWLSYYGQHFSTVEINATFYGGFSKETFASWRQQVGDDFAFTLKGPRFITHVKRLKDPDEPIKRFLRPAQGLGRRLSCVLWQFPKNFQCGDESLARLETFLQTLPNGVRQAFELRHPSWFTDTVFTLLDRHGAGFVINDSPQFPSVEQVTGDFAYVRFHGPGKLYATSYSKAALAAWARTLRHYLDEYDVYCYFNNDHAGYAIKNARALRKSLERSA